MWRRRGVGNLLGVRRVAGKTTILRIIAVGTTYRAKSYCTKKTHRASGARTGVGVIFQSYALFPKMTVEKTMPVNGLRINTGAQGS